MNKYKYIVSCGCSWVEGYGTSNRENRLSSLISKHYDAIDINLAEGGGSNEMIFRKIFDWIQDNTDKLKDTLFSLKKPTPEKDDKGLVFMTEAYASEISEYNGYYAQPKLNQNLHLFYHPKCLRFHL